MQPIKPDFELGIILSSYVPDKRHITRTSINVPK